NNNQLLEVTFNQNNHAWEVNLLSSQPPVEVEDQITLKVNANTANNREVEFALPIDLSSCFPTTLPNFRKNSTIEIKKTAVVSKPIKKSAPLKAKQQR